MTSCKELAHETDPHLVHILTKFEDVEIDLFVVYFDQRIQKLVEILFMQPFSTFFVVPPQGVDLLLQIDQL